MVGESFLARLKVLLAYKADGAGPVVGEFFEGCSWRDIVLGVAHIGIVHPVAYGAFILLHGGVGL